MQYTPGQLRDTAGLSKEAFRHWKRVVPAFCSGKGHSPTFSPGDVLASAVLRRLTEVCGIPISHLTCVTDRIFEICNNTSWNTLKDRILIIDLSSQRCLILKNTSEIAIGNALIICPFRPLLSSIQESLLQSPVTHNGEKALTRKTGK